MYHKATLARSSFSAACTTGLGLPTVTRTHRYHYCIIRTHHSCAPSCYILPHTEHNLPSPRSFRSRVPINTQLINPFRKIS